MKSVILVGIVVLAIGLGVLIFKPIPSCFVGVGPLCIAGNPIMGFTFGLDPNILFGGSALVLGAIFAGLGARMGGRTKRRGAAKPKSIELLLGIVLAIGGLVDALLPFAGLLLLSGVGVNLPGTGYGVVLQSWQLGIIIFAVGALLIYLALSSSKGGRK
jgi:hypothetical protein